MKQMLTKATFIQVSCTLEDNLMKKWLKKTSIVIVPLQLNRLTWTHLANTCSKLTIETLEQGKKYVQI